jgi:hypothetical protein
MVSAMDPHGRNLGFLDPGLILISSFFNNYRDFHVSFVSPLSEYSEFFRKKKNFPPTDFIILYFHVQPKPGMLLF